MLGNAEKKGFSTEGTNHPKRGAPSRVRAGREEKKDRGEKTN